MKKLFLFVAVMMAAVAFSSCSKDEENEGEDGNKISIVNQIIQQDDDGRIITWEFDYDAQNRITKTTCENKKESIGEYDIEQMLFSYSAGKVTVTQPQEYGDNIYNATLNGQGYIETLKLRDILSTKHFYDANGYLTKTTWESNDESYTLQSSWNNGNLVRENNVTYEYNNMRNRMNIDIYALLFLYPHVIDNPEIIYAVGLIGEKSKNLMTKQIDGNHYCNFTYEMNANGDPVKITVSTDYGNSIFEIIYQ